MLVSGRVIVQGVTVFGNIARHWKIRGPEDDASRFSWSNTFFCSEVFSGDILEVQIDFFFLNGSFREYSLVLVRVDHQQFQGTILLMIFLTCRVFVTAQISFFGNEESNKTCNTQGGGEVYHPTCMCLGSQNQLMGDHLVYMKMCEVN